MYILVRNQLHFTTGVEEGILTFTPGAGGVVYIKIQRKCSAKFRAPDYSLCVTLGKVLNVKSPINLLLRRLHWAQYCDIFHFAVLSCTEFHEIYLLYSKLFHVELEPVICRTKQPYSSFACFALNR